MANDKRFLWMFLATLVFVLGGLQNTMGKERVHSIAKKDSLESVAARYGCHVDLLIEWNEKKAAAGFVDLSTIISNFDELPKGKKLWLPPASACEKGSEGPKTSELPALERGRAYNCVWDAENIETGRLAQLMNQRGFLPPSSFRALVVKHQLERDDKGRPKRVLHHLYDYAGLASDWRGWNPASTIKVYSGLAAVERVKRLGFDPEKVQITYHDAAGDRSYPMSELLEKAMHISKNVPHNRLVQLAGFDYINARPRDLVGGGASSGGFLSLRGMHDSFIMVGYALSEWRALGQSASLRFSPPITLEQEGRTLQLAEQRSNQNYSCKKAACTTLSDLSKQICYDVLRRGLTMPSLDSDHSYYEDQGTGIPDTELAILAPIHFEAACLKAKQAGENCNPITTRNR